METKEFNTLEDMMAYVERLNSAYAQPKQEKQMEQTKQNMALDNVKAGKFIVGSVDFSGAVSFSSYPVPHDTAQQARSECRRLSALNSGKAFIFAKLTGAELVPMSKSISI
jgi:hypothetical protein